MTRFGLTLAALVLLGSSTSGQMRGAAQFRGQVTDDSGGVLPGVSVEVRPLGGGPSRETLTSSAGEYAFPDVAPGRYQLSFTLINFASVVRKDVDVAASALTVNAVMHFALNAEVTVTGVRSFINL